MKTLLTLLASVAFAGTAFAHDGHSEPSTPEPDSSEPHFERLGNSPHKATDHTYQNHYHVTDENGDPALPELRWKYGYLAFWIASLGSTIAIYIYFHKVMKVI